MKKLMIVAAIALATSFGYGATASWGTDWVYADITGFKNFDDGSANGSYWVLVLGTSSDVSGISVDKDGKLVGWSGSTVPTGSLADISQGGNGSVDGVSANDYIAIVVYDSDAVAGDYVGAYGIAVGQVSGDASDDPPVTGVISSNGTDPVFDNDGSGYVRANIGILGGSTPGGIPEPTSGLLLLVGGAMLALRRKRG